MKALFLGIAAILVVVAGCDDDSDCVNCPPRGVGPTPNPTLENIWPNDNGMRWVYDHTAAHWNADVTYYPTEDAVPMHSLPHWYEVFEYLETNVPPQATQTTTGTMTLQFDGLTTTQSGVTAQNLVAEVVTNPRPGRVAPDRDWRRDRSPLVNEGPLVLHGGAWVKSASGIVTYGDIGQEPTWKFLESDLSVGSTFTLQLVPQFKDDAFLHGVVFRQVNVETEVGTFQKALDCLYIIDWGITRVIDLQGQTVGYLRVIDLGRVIYAPRVGPVYCYERGGIQLGESLTAGGGDMTERLSDTNVTGR